MRKIIVCNSAVGGMSILKVVFASAKAKSSLYSLHTSYSLHFSRNNSLRCTYGTTRRSAYPRMYKTVLVLLDGSTLTVRCREPKAMLQLPVDMDSLDEKERLNLWVSRKKKRSAIDSDYLDTTFDAETYTQYWKK